LAEYISYAKKYINPVISEDAAVELVKARAEPTFCDPYMVVFFVVMIVIVAECVPLRCHVFCFRACLLLNCVVLGLR